MSIRIHSGGSHTKAGGSHGVKTHRRGGLLLRNTAVGAVPVACDIRMVLGPGNSVVIASESGGGLGGGVISFCPGTYVPLDPNTLIFTDAPNFAGIGTVIIVVGGNEVIFP